MKSKNNFIYSDDRDEFELFLLGKNGKRSLKKKLKRLSSKNERRRVSYV